MTQIKNVQRSHIEASGFIARHYDHWLDFVTFGYYWVLLRHVVRDLELTAGESVLDFGAGTGRMAALIAACVGPEGRVMGLEIHPEMQARYRRRMATHPNMTLLDQRIEEIFTLARRYDRVLMSFVLHGFEQYQRILILQNAYDHLEPDGELCVLDWNCGDLRRAPGLVRIFFERESGAAARDFMVRDWRMILASYRFSDCREYLYGRGHIRLIRCRRY